MGISFAPDLAVVLSEPSPKWAPPRSGLPMVVPAFREPPTVLLVGRPLTPKDRRVVEQHAQVLHVDSLEAGLARMAEARFAAVVVTPTVSAEADGVRFVRAFKSSALLSGASGELHDLRSRYAQTPFLIQPIDGDTQYAVFTNSTRWYLEHTTRVPFAVALLGSIKTNRV